MKTEDYMNAYGDAVNKAAQWLDINILAAFNLDLGHTDMLREFIDNFKEAMKNER